MPLFGRLMKTKRRSERREERREISETSDTPVTGPLGILPRPLPRLKKNAKLIQDKYFDTEKHKDPERSTYEKVRRKLANYEERYGTGEERKKKDLRCKPGELRCGKKRGLAGWDKPMVDAQQFGTIRDIDQREDLQLVTDSQEVENIKAHFGNPPTLDDFQGFFVTIQDGDYGEVYAFEGSVPNLDKALWKVDYPASGKALGGGELAAIYTQNMTPEQIRAQIDKLVDMKQMTSDEGKIIMYTDVIKGLTEDLEQMKPRDSTIFQGGALSSNKPLDFEIIKEGPIFEEPGAYPSRIVLTKYARGYTTHIQALPPGGEPYMIHGNYFVRLVDAENDYDERVKQYSDRGVLAGMHRDTPSSKFDQEQLQKGIKIEMEHTNDPKEAEEIAKDHLSEISDYYTRLEKMEAEATEHGECELCKTACDTLGDPDYCKLKFKQMTDGEITKDQLDADLNKKYGDDWIDKVMAKLGG